MDEKLMQHGHMWRGQRLKGWLLSEKFDGIRAYWDGAQMWARSGSLIRLPALIRRSLPAGVPLDGEIWAGYGQLSAARLAVTHGRWTPAHRFLVFDAPSHSGFWLERLAFARGVLRHPLRVEVVQAEVATSHQHPFRLMKQVHARGGEGVIARAPDLAYRPGRTEEIVKLKRAFYQIFAGRV